MHRENYGAWKNLQIRQWSNKAPRLSSGNTPTVSIILSKFPQLAEMAIKEEENSTSGSEGNLKILNGNEGSHTNYNGFDEFTHIDNNTVACHINLVVNHK